MKKNNYSTSVIRIFVCFFLLAFLSFQSEAYSAPSDYYDIVQKAYIGYYQRPADPGGLLYWAERLDASGGRLTDIINAFANSAESQVLYNTIDSSNISGVVNGIYNVLFGRDADSAGLAYYVNGFNSSKFNAATIMMNILDGAQNEDLHSVNNKLAAANIFTGTVTNLEADYSGNTDANAARGFLGNVTSNTTTIPNQNEMSQFIQDHIKQITIAQSRLARSTTPDTSDSEIDALVEGNNEFGFDLYQAIRQSEGNLFYSPYSISMALTLAYAGARTQTEAEMAAVLHYGLAQDRLHPTFNALDLILESRGEGASGTGGTGFSLNIANAIWGEKTYAFLPEYLDVLAVNYGAGLRLLDFINNPEPSRIAINDWVAEETENKIQGLFPQGAISSTTRLVLSNAIYFNAAWGSPFEKTATEPGNFYLLTDQTIVTDLMKQTKYFGYASGPDYSAVALPYSGGKLDMILFVPDKGKFQEFEDKLSAAKVNDIISSLIGTDVHLTMPKFTFGSKLGLKDTLQKLGMTTAFTDADFSGMDGTLHLSISDVLHKAWVKVDEERTEAAAATGIGMKFTSVPPPPLDMTIDRPFIFLIRDIPTGSILFMGRVVNPKEQ